MTTIEKEKAVDSDAWLYPNYTESDLDFLDDMYEFELAEFAGSKLRELIADCGRESYLEKKKENPDQIGIQKLGALIREIYANERVTDFNNRDDMVNLIKKYSPMLRRVNFGGQLA